MSTRAQKFYMVRLKGGEWEPRRKHTSLADAMIVAHQMAKFHSKPATVLQTLCRVEIVDGKPHWTDATPEIDSRTPGDTNGPSRAARKKRTTRQGATP